MKTLKPIVSMKCCTLRSAIMKIDKFINWTSARINAMLNLNLLMWQSIFYTYRQVLQIFMIKPDISKSMSHSIVYLCHTELIANEKYITKYCLSTPYWCARIEIQ